MNRILWSTIFLLRTLPGLQYVNAQLTAPSHGEVHAITCEDGWSRFRDHCYFLSESTTDGRTYWKARDDCRRYGGTLVSIHSEEEQEFVLSLLKNEVEAWIGLSTKGTQSKTLKWDDETTTRYLNFSASDLIIPSASAVNNSCFFIIGKQRRDWIADACEQYRSFICKKLMAITPGDSGCADCERKHKSRTKRSSRVDHSDTIASSLPWRMLQGKTDHHDLWNMKDNHLDVLHPWKPETLPDSQLPPKEASFLPLGNHGRFSSPFHSKFSNTFLQPDELERHHQNAQEILQRINKIFQAPTLFSEPTRHRLGSYADHGSAKRSKQLSGNVDSNVYFPSLPAASVSLSQATTNSTDSLASVTKSVKVNAAFVPTLMPRLPTQPVINATRCRENDFDFSGSCYTMSDPDDRRTYSAAYSSCKEKRAHLVVINSLEEQRFLSKLLGNTSIPAWIGLKQIQNGSSENIFQWADGTIMDESDWKFIVKDQLNETCIAVLSNLTEEESWLSKGCNENSFLYICEYAPEEVLYVSEGCLEGWEDVNHRCYKVFPKPASWIDSENHCKVFGGHLASAGSVEEEDILRRLAQNSDVSEFFSSFWVGLQIDSESNYKWTDSSPMSYLNWAEGEPDFHREMEHCGSATRRSFRLHDSPCDAFLPFICEAAQGTMLNVEQSPQTKPDKTFEDDPSWLLYADHCYKIFSSREEDLQTWWTSRRLCREIGGELASIHSAEENYWLQSQVYNLSDTVLWIGGLSYMDSGYEWADGTPFDFSNWAKGEPNNNYDQEDCVSFYTHNFGYWNDQNCAHTQGWVCKRPSGSTHPPPVTTQPPKGNCPAGWMHAGPKCLKFIKEKVTFDDARKACKILDHTSELVSIASAKEQAYLTAALGELKVNTWIGLLYEQGYHWTDQSALTYTNWARGEPSSGGWMDPLHSENCVGLHTYNLAGQWNNIYCKALLGYVCQLRPDPDLPSSDPLPACATPYENYYRYNGRCYRPESNAKTREEAESICISEGGHLASAVNRAESSWLWVLAQQYNLDDPWIGLSNKRDNNVFEWSDNWPTIYTKWGPGEPNVTRPHHNCVRLSSDDGLWYTGNCSEAGAFICKHNNEAFPTPDPPTGGSCPSSQWLDFGGSFCYLLSTEEVPWEDANKRCALENSNLTSIHSKAEMDLIVQAAHNIPDPIWIGLIQMKDGFGWSDGTGYDFVNWQDGEPNSGGEECAEIYPGTGLWNDAFCNNARPFICKIAKRNGRGNLQNMGRPAELTGKSSPSPGAIAGIVIPLLLLVAGGAAFLFYQNKKKPKPLGNSGTFGFDNAVYSEDVDSHLDLDALQRQEEEEEEKEEEEEVSTEIETKVEIQDEDSNSET